MSGSLLVITRKATKRDCTEGKRSLENQERQSAEGRRMQGVEALKSHRGVVRRKDLDLLAFISLQEPEATIFIPYNFWVREIHMI